MKMPQRHIIKALKHLCVYIIRATYREFLRLAGSRAGDELVGQQHIAGVFVQRHVLYRRAYGIGVAFDARVGIKPPYMGRLHKGQQPEVHRAIFIRERNRFYLPTVYR